MVGPESRGSVGDRVVVGHEADTGRIQEPIDRRISSLLQRPDHHLGVDRRADQQLVARGQARTELIDGTLVLRIPGIEKRDQQIGVERYARHSSRSWSRCPGG